MEFRVVNYLNDVQHYLILLNNAFSQNQIMDVVLFIILDYHLINLH